MDIITFQRLEYAFEYFESGSNGSKFYLNALNLVRLLEFEFECFESVRICIQVLRTLSNRSKLDSKASNPFQMV